MRNDIKIIYKWIATILFACSFAILSLSQSILYTKWIIFLTVFLSFFCSVFFVKNAGKSVCSYIERHFFSSSLIAVVSVDMAIHMQETKIVIDMDQQLTKWNIDFSRFEWWIPIIPALCFFLIWVWNKIQCFVYNFWKSMDQFHQKLYITIMVISAVAILFLYENNQYWYSCFDAVYSIDSGWCSENLFPNMSYFDIRHPFLSVGVFPLWTSVRFFLSLFVSGSSLDLLCVVCIQIINVQLLLLTGLMIERLCKSRMAFFLYLSSSPALLFSVFFEKYQICTFLLVLYVYKRCEEEHNSEANLIYAAGAMPTSIFAGITELFLKGSWKNKMYRLFRIVIQGLILLICTGRVHLLNPQLLFTDVFEKTETYGNIGLSVRECFFSFAKMVQASFWALPSEKTADLKFLWNDLLEGVSFFQLLILFIIAIGIFVARKEKFVKFCSVWVAFSVILFFVFQWGVNEGPLFSIYFSWALIPLFQKGIQYIAVKLRWKETGLYVIILSSMVMVNLLNLLDINRFLNQFLI